MSADRNEDPGSLPVGLLDAIDQVCDRFESALAAGGRPRIEDYLADVTASGQEVLFHQLLGAELDWRRGRGERPARAEYLSRFPARGPLIEAAFAGVGTGDTRETAVRFPPRGMGEADHSTSSGPASEGARGGRDDRRLGAGDEPTWSPRGGKRRLGRFELLEAVGVGAFGAVYKARDPQLDRVVAIKVPRVGNLATDEDRDRFLREARSVAQLRHPGIVPVHEVGEHEGVSYLVSDFVRGMTLSDLLKSRRPSPSEAAGLVAEVADALQYAHEQGVVHRDVKPSNILLDGAGRPHVTDFGLARRDAGEVTMTIDGQVLGTPAYMSPEQAKGEGHWVDGRGDVYSLGVILYELLTGELPFRGNTRMLLHQVLHDEPRSPRNLDDRIPRDLETICLKAMAKEPTQRYQASRELSEDLARYLGGEPILARPAGRAEKLWRWCRRNPAVAGLMAAVAASLISGTVVSLAFAVQATIMAREVVKAKHRADAGALEARRSAYGAQINLAQMAWREGNSGRVLELLEEHRPKPGQEDLRGWEWHYLWRLCHEELRTFTSRIGPSWMQSIAFSPDGRHLALANEHGMVQVWDAATRREMHMLEGNSGGANFYRLAYSPDGHQLASASRDGKYRYWDADGGQVLREGKVRIDELIRAEFSPDGRHLAATGGGGGIVIWDTTTDRELRTLSGDTSQVDNMAFDPDSRRLAAAEMAGIRIWDIATGRELHILKGDHGIGASGLEFSPDGRHIAATGMETTVWDIATGQRLLALKGPGVAVGASHRLAYSADGRRLAAVGENDTIMIWDADNGRQLRALKGGFDSNSSLAFSPDGHLLASAGMSGEVRIWDAYGNQPLRGDDVLRSLEGHSDQVEHMAYSPDGTRLASSSLFEGRVWDAESGQLKFTFKEPLEVQSIEQIGTYDLAFSPDGRRLVVPGRDGRITSWDAAAGRELRSLKFGHASGGHECHPITIGLEGRRLAGASEGGTITVWDAATAQRLSTLKCNAGRVVGLAFSPEGRRLAGASEGGTITVWDVDDGQQSLFFKNIPLHSQATAPAKYGMAYSPDGRRLAVPGREITVWDTDHGRRLLTLKGHNGVHEVSYSPDGTRIASTSVDGSVRIWDADGGRQLFILEGDPDIILGVVAEPSSDGGVSNETMLGVKFSPDGRLLAARCADGTLRIWDARTPTAGLSAHREALALVNCLIARRISLNELLAVIRRDVSIGELVRQRALTLAEPLWRGRVRAEAKRVVQTLFAKPLFREEVLKVLRADSTLAAQNPEARATALALAETWPESASSLNDAAWTLVEHPNRPEADYQRGIRLSQAAIRMEPDNGVYLNTLGAAQYRARQYERALITLTRSNRLIENGDPANLAFLAMTQQRLKLADTARATLERLREVMKEPEILDVEVEVNKGLLTEAESIILSSAELPEDVFTP